MIIFYLFIVLLVIGISSSNIGFALAQNSAYDMTFFSSILPDINKYIMTINTAQNNPDSTAAESNGSVAILMAILTVADISGIAVVGLVIATVYYQKRERRFAGLIESFKLLNGKEQREARLKLFEAYHKYKKANDLGIFQDEIYREYVERVIHDFDEVGSLVRNGLISKNAFFDVFWNTTIRCWNASKVTIDHRRSSRDFPHYMINFEMLAKEAELYMKKHHEHASEASLEP